MKERIIFTNLVLINIIIVFFGLIFLTAKSSGESLENIVDEGPCPVPFAPKVYEDLDEDWFRKAEADGWYMPFMSKIYAYSLAQLFTGKVPEAETEFNKMCASIFCTPAQTNFTAYGASFVMKCKQGTTGVLVCTDSKQIHAVLVVTWADNKNYALMNTCYGGRKAWFLCSTIPTVTPKAKAAVLNEIKKFKFDPQKTFALDYNKCPKVK